MFILYILLSSVAVAQAAIEGFIVGGYRSIIERYPHSAALYVTCESNTNNKKANWRCGSSILNQWLLLTAAHCLYPCDYHARIIANMGDEHRSLGIQRTEERFIIHKNYDAVTLAADIAMIKLTAAIEFSVQIGRVAIMEKPPYIEPASLAGWGLTDEEKKTPGLLLKNLDQHVKIRQICKDIFDDLLPPGTFCAESEKLNDYASLGDSGSALTVRGYIQIGIASFKISSHKNILVYTDVGYFFGWINENARKIVCNEF